MLSSNFASKTFYTNKNILYLFNRTIYEFDMKSANTSLSRRYKLLPEETIKKLESMDKIRRNVTVGNLQKNKEFRNKLTEAFKDTRADFYRENDLDENDIISVKRDAIFTTKDCQVTEFDNVIFVKKNSYTSYIQLKNLELYYRPGVVDVKGIDDSELKYHTDGILNMIMTFFKKMETGTPEEPLSYMNRMISKYKRRELPLEYYREFNSGSYYVEAETFDEFDDYWDDDIEDLDITFNFSNILIPLIKIAL